MKNKYDFSETKKYTKKALKGMVEGKEDNTVAVILGFLFFIVLTIEKCAG